MAIQKKIVSGNLELLVSGRIDGAVANDLEVEILNGIRSDMYGVFRSKCSILRSSPRIQG